MQRAVSANDVWMDKWLDEEYTYKSVIEQSLTFGRWMHDAESFET